MALFENLMSTEKLTSSAKPHHFHFWKIRIDIILYDAGVKYVLTTPKPSSPTDDSSPKDNETYEKWLSDDRRCRDLMVIAMDELLFTSFDHHETAKEMMEALTQMLAPTTLAYRFSVYRKYTQHKMADETLIHDHILHMYSMAARLRYAGMPVSEELETVVLMNSLPESWQDCLTMFMCRGDGEMGLTDLVRILRIHGDLRKMKNGGDTESGKKKETTGNRGFRGNCYACGRPGHCQSDCPEKD